MPDRILVINPNSSIPCTEGIAAALAPLGPHFRVIRLAEGPPAIATWRHWFQVAEPLCQVVEREAAAAYVIACLSDPGLEAVRGVTARPVLGMFRCAVASALAAAPRIGVMGFVAASEARQRRALQAMAVEDRLAAWLPLDLPMEVLVDAVAPRARIRAVAKALAAAGAGAIVLGCTGLAGHAAAAEDAAGIPVIEPCLAAGTMALQAIHDPAMLPAILGA
ncbi:MAG: Asp/Glu racemase [Belnapia sp.]|nr:Asp/Glu racemase [Belnapia sp.]